MKTDDIYIIYIYYDTEVFSKHHACVILWKCFKLCLYKARGVDSLGPPHPGRPSPRSAAQARLRRDPPCRGGARGRRASGGPSPPLRPAPDPPPRRSTPPARALGALRRQGHGRGPLGSYAFGVSGTASPACRVASHSLPLAHAVHTTETTPTHRPSRPLSRPSRRYVPPTASQLEAAPEALEDLLHSCSLCRHLLLLNRALSLPFSPFLCHLYLSLHPLERSIITIPLSLSFFFLSQPPLCPVPEFPSCLCTVAHSSYIHFQTSKIHLQYPHSLNRGFCRNVAANSLHLRTSYPKKNLSH